MAKAKAKPKAAPKAASATFIKHVGTEDVRKYGAGQIGDINKLSESRDYASEPDIQGSGVGSVVQSRREKITEFEVKQRMAELFPILDPGERALDCLVIVQELRVPRTMGGGGLLRADSTIDADQATTSYGKVISIGPLAFKQDVTGEDFPGGASYQIGDIVRTPKMGGQEFLIDDIVFNYFKDRDMKGVITDLRKIIAIYF